MIVYSSTKAEFIQNVNDANIEDIIYDNFERILKKSTSQSEIDSWRDSLPFMSQVLTDKEIPDNAGILIEYMLPQSAFRVDFIITGQDEEHKENVVIVELKRWSESQLSEKDGIVKTILQGGIRETNHPSYQAWSYSAYLSNFNETIYKENITLNPCAYLHNYTDNGVLTNNRYEYYTSKAPVFMKSDKIKLREFIKKHIQLGDENQVMYRIENGKIKPSKSLADSLVNMLKHNKEEFIMLDDQKIVFETALSGARKSDDQNKNVLIVSGGPGTGKSVIAINLLVNLIKNGLNTKYITKNAAPREVYKEMLTKSFPRKTIDFLFSSSGIFYDTQKNTFDALIVDEAHRLNGKSGMFAHLGENQIKEIIHSSRFSVFFIDEDQKVTTKDIGSRDEILKWANHHQAKIRELDLKSQFRCNGSNGYLAWLDNSLQIRDTANIYLHQDEYDFQIVDSPDLLWQRTLDLNTKNKSRMVAGYCWDWISKKDKNKNDIEFPELNFGHKWNLEKDGSTWIISKDSISEIGCIHTCQGLELEHVGVIIGPDLIVREGKIITDMNKRAKTDKSLNGLGYLSKKNPTKAIEIADQIIKNTYRTLLTRGMKSCTVYFTDSETAAYFKGRIRK